MSRTYSSVGAAHVLALIAVAATFTLAGASSSHPPNTALTLVANVSSTTLANDDYWEGKCGAIPEVALFVRLEMGTVSEVALSGCLHEDLRCVLFPSCLAKHTRFHTKCYAPCFGRAR